MKRVSSNSTLSSDTDALHGTIERAKQELVHVSDAFDAMRTNRVYQSALSPEATVREITEGAGTQFDSEVVKVFKSCYKELDNLHDRKKL